MTLLQIAIFAALLLAVRLALSDRRRANALGALSVLSFYWLQPATPLRNIDFWLPTLSLGLVLWVWSSSRPRGPLTKEERWSLLVFAGLIAVVALTRYLGPLCCLTATRPPPILLAVIAAGAILAFSLILSWMASPRLGLAGGVLILLFLFITLKAEPLARAASTALRTLTGQDPALASGLDIRWLGFSYLAFRLLHILRDVQTGKVYSHSLAETVTYALFFPSLTAGPIDRAPRFITELGQPKALSSEELAGSGYRIFLGIFKKFALADSLAIFALSPQNAPQAQAGAWSWVLLYAYAFRIYFDFSGYTDIAIGLGRLVGVHLPENFSEPYIQTNLTNFWNRWHITLAQWFRAYFFNPVTRALRQNPRHIPIWMIILIGQAGTMLLIGLWHGITWNFAVWGAWHAGGLFVHNRWTEWLRPRLEGQTPSPSRTRLLQATGWVLTFHYITLGWVWFALPDLLSAWNYWLKLFGVSV